MIKEVRISGTGGQGVILAGLVLAEAAGIYEDKPVVQVQDYGGAVRGGAVRSEVLIASESQEEIMFPAVEKADILVALSQQAANKWTEGVKEDGCIIYDITSVREVPVSSARIYTIPITEATKKQFGSELGLNIVAVGALCAVTGIVSREALNWAVLQRAPRGTGEYNKEALELGFSLGDGFGG